ncbi:MAG: 2Fe-2S iron-sulfur cluster-binding protein [Gammaproteobacteria bacterium]|nr:2Fe-2S iron-sulfur cluster-binding protein [Gammaproteobacteria bacterium]
MFNQIFNIQLNKNKRNFECSENDSILEGGLRHGLAMHYECSNGTCGACVARLVNGDIKQIKHHDFSLTKDQKNQDEFLMCCNVPASDITLELELIGDVRSIAIQNIETKVKKINLVNDNLAIITLRTPRSKTLQFMAGQDVELSFKGSTSRYPLASCPCHGMELEFHIRNMPKDAFATALFTKKIKSKSAIKLEGPKGIFVLKEASTRPMVFIAWDSGFAPIRSLVEHAFSLEMSNPVYFYWAHPADEKTPYLENHAKSWQVIMDDYTYTPIACDFDRSSKNDCHKVAKQIFKALDLNIVNQSDLYISAPAEVLIYLGELLLENGLNESQLIASPI